MFNRNHVELIGHVSSNPVVRTLGNGEKVCNVSMATNESWKGKDTGERRQRPTFHQLTVWTEKTIAFVEQHVRSGDFVHVTAKLDYSASEKNGETRYHTNIVVKAINFLQAKDADGSGEE